MSTVYVSRDSQGNISGVYARPQPGHAEEALDDQSPAVLDQSRPRQPRARLTTRQIWERDGVGSLFQSVASGVKRALALSWLVVGRSGADAGGPAVLRIEPGASLAITAGTSTLTVALSRTGEVTCWRSAGADDLFVALDLWFL